MTNPAPNFTIKLNHVGARLLQARTVTVTGATAAPDASNPAAGIYRYATGAATAVEVTIAIPGTFEWTERLPNNQRRSRSHAATWTLRQRYAISGGRMRPDLGSGG